MAIPKGGGREGKKTVRGQGEGGARGNARTRDPFKKGCIITEANWGGMSLTHEPINKIGNVLKIKIKKYLRRIGKLTRLVFLESTQ